MSQRRGRSGEAHTRLMSEPAIRDVSDTAFWIAQHRAEETMRSDALFRDPFAARLAGERGARIAHEMPASGFIGWTVALRTRIIDEFIRDAIHSGVDTILNLGAGLDARPYRMELPEDLKWIEADYARIIEYKEQVLRDAQPLCRLERVKIDLADRGARQSMLRDVGMKSQRCLALTEGVIPYLTAEDAAALADDLLEPPSLRWWVLDYMSSDAQRHRRARLGKILQNAPFRFRTDDWFSFFAQHGWRAKELRYYVEESAKVGRAVPLPVWMKALWGVRALFMSEARRNQLSKSAGYALLERVG